MKFFNISILSLATLLTSSLVSATVDWTSSNAQACALENWSAIKAVVDPKILQSWEFMPGVIKALMAQSGALNSDHTLINNPTANQIVAISRGFPAGIFSPYGDNIVQKCLDNGGAGHETTTSETTSTEQPEPTSTEQPEPTISSTSEKQETTSSAEEGSETSTSAEQESKSGSSSAEKDSEFSTTAEEGSETDTASESTSAEEGQETATSSAPVPTSTDAPKCIPKHAY
ncbi:hypothetical protein IW140_005659 [Coemansia sp. RSA 1813]|nr:hypothetical protein EV178_005245 [Coemansia sp. RSA 1646]KAJ1767770.1 hypothetical protein LPJ74_005198 [Coemansia sp. RSA 1843]KAJ2212800.1 hypothetical protein EV179_004367 [Coemansia sp. RSA 487]KAJ2564634.1 hypothetical protein IW140_005659 [Coemansia sp. RSA 1813]